MTPAQLAIHTDGAVSCGTVVWRFRGHLQLTVVVKATFAIVPDGVATPVGPGEIVGEDRHLDGSPFRSVAEASDLAPYLPRCDVLFAGHAHAIGEPTAAAAVRLGVSRHGQWLLDKTIHVYGDRGPDGAPQPFTHMPIVYERAGGGAEPPNVTDPTGAPWPAGFGAISRLWSARRVVLGQVDPSVLELPIPDIPEEMPWDYFQAAPPDQQIEMLHGGEWLVLEGLDPSRARVQTRLPAARAVACIAMRGPDGEPAESAVDLACDTLAIDGDAQTFSLTWRGGYELLEGEAALHSLAILAAMEAPGVPVDWERIWATPAIQPPAPAPPHATRPRAMTVDPSQFAAISRDAALPFKPSGLPGRPPSTDATPWATAPARAEPAAKQDTVPAKPARVALTFGLGMRLASAPLGNIRFPTPELLQPPLADDDEPVTLQPNAPPRPEPQVPAMAALWAELTPLEPERLLELERVPEPERVLEPERVPEPEPEPERAPEPSPPPRPVITASWSEPPPPIKLVPPPADPWRRPLEPPAEPPPPPRPPPKTFERPATAAVMGGFYAKFGRK